MLRFARIATIVLALAALTLFAAGCAMAMPTTSPAASSAATDAAASSAATDAAASSAATDAAAPAPVPGELTVVDVRARPAPLEGGNGAVFLTVLNGTDKAVRLTSAASGVASVVELHETTEQDGVMKMEPRPDGFEIAAGGNVMLAPGGKHVMLIGLAKPLAEGDSFALALNFDNGQVIDVTVPVVAMAAMPAMGGAGAMGGTSAMTGTNMMTGTGEMTGTSGMGSTEQPAETPTTQP